jgi:hypothetical protein
MERIASHLIEVPDDSAAGWTHPMCATVIAGSERSKRQAMGGVRLATRVDGATR